MDIEILEEFVNLVETCNFQETAAQMNISQSALTKHIHKLEDELNLSLFDRSTRSVGLNEFSRALYPYAKQVVELKQEAYATLYDLANKDKTTLTISYMPILGRTDSSKHYLRFPIRIRSASCIPSKAISQWHC